MQDSPEDEEPEERDEEDDNDFMGFEGIYRHTEQQGCAPTFNGARASTDDMDAGASPDYITSCPNRSDVRLQCIGVDWCVDPKCALFDCSPPCNWNVEVCATHGQNTRLPLFRNRMGDVRLPYIGVNWCDDPKLALLDCSCPCTWNLEVCVVHGQNARLPFFRNHVGDVRLLCYHVNGYGLLLGKRVDYLSWHLCDCNAQLVRPLECACLASKFSCFDNSTLVCFDCGCVCRLHDPLYTHLQASSQCAHGSPEVMGEACMECDFCQRQDLLEHLKRFHVSCLVSSSKPSALCGCLTCGLTTLSMIQSSGCSCDTHLPFMKPVHAPECCYTPMLASAIAIPQGLNAHAQLKEGSPWPPAHVTYMTESDRWSPPDFTPLPEDQDDDLPDFDGDRDEPAKVDSLASAPGSQPGSTESATTSNPPEPAAELDKGPPKAASQVTAPAGQSISQIPPPAPVAIPDAEPEIIEVNATIVLDEQEQGSQVGPLQKATSPEQQQNSSQDEAQFAADVQRADELAGRLHLGLILDTQAKPGTDKSALFEQVALNLGTIRREMAQIKDVMMNLLTGNKEMVWALLFHAICRKPAEWEEELNRISDHSHADAQSDEETLCHLEQAQATLPSKERETKGRLGFDATIGGSAGHWSSSCGQLEDMEHIILHCPALVGAHRDYIMSIQDDHAKRLLARTGLPVQCEAVESRGKKEYIRFSHHLACSLVRRDIINAHKDEFWPTRYRIRAKQPRPIAYLPDRGAVGIKLKRARPNVAQRATLDYKLDEEGVWHVNAHEMQPSEQGPEPRLVCRKCKASSLWRLKHVLFT
eukprot:2798724-Amphidinium_carterae.2